MLEPFASHCTPTSFSYYPATQVLPKPIFIFACISNSINSVLSVLGNIVILSALPNCQTLHSPSKALLCSLALTDLIVGLVVLPLFVTYHLTNILEMPTYYCTLSVLNGRTAAFIAAASLFTLVTTAAERFLAFHLGLRYRVIVTFNRVVSILVLEWIVAALWSGSFFFWSERGSIFFAEVVSSIFCLIVPLFYLSIHRGLLRHVAQVYQPASTREPANINLLRYRKTIANMMWIYGFFLMCYMPYVSSMLAIVITGFTNATRNAEDICSIAIYFNSSLNPVLYCWRIKELKQKVKAYYNALSCYFFQSR